jgi:hypothetical protein
MKNYLFNFERFTKVWQYLTDLHMIIYGKNEYYIGLINLIKIGNYATDK